MERLGLTELHAADLDAILGRLEDAGRTPQSTVVATALHDGRLGVAEVAAARQLTGSPQSPS